MAKKLNQQVPGRENITNSKNAILSTILFNRKLLIKPFRNVRTR